jgi:hypothetical protein
MSQLTQFFTLQGGLDLTTPAIRTPAGHLIAGLNYEPVERGYRRVDGIERFDGQPKPSEAVHYTLDFESGNTEAAVGDTITGATSGATGVVIYATVLESGQYASSDARGYVILSPVTGTFTNGENLQVSAVTIAVAVGTQAESGGDTDALSTAYEQAAIEAARTLIAAPAGDNGIRGVWVYEGDKYCVKDNAGATAGVLYKATTAGWVAQSLGREIAFTSGGTYEIAEGDTITGATSAATAVITRVVVTSGDWTTGDAAGYLYFASQTGTFQAENLNVGANLNVATIAGNSSALALPAGGRYEFTNHNFYGSTNLARMYGCNGVGPAFEWDGTVFVPVRPVGLSDALNKPDHIFVHKMQLFMSFAGGSIQHSGVGTPTVVTARTGASEIGLGHDVTGFEHHGQVLLIAARTKMAVLYGNDVDDFVLESLNEKAGAIEWTLQKVAFPIYMDDRGLRDIRTTASFGDFKAGTISQIVEPLFTAKKKAGITPLASIVVRSKDQYRLFWSDGTGITTYLGRKYPEHGAFDLGITINCACSGENDDGTEILLVGGTDGMVYELDAGTSFDGEQVDAYARLPFNHVGSPTQNKRWHKATLEVDADPSVVLGITADFSYADSDLPGVAEQTFTVTGGGGFWSEGNWGEFYWSSPVEGIAECYIDGFGKNMSITIVSQATYEDPHTIHGLTIHFSYRGLAR